MPIKDNIKRRRQEIDMTLDAVAKVVGVTRATIQKYESGVISNIPSDKIELLAKALNTTPAFLMGWVRVPTPWQDAFCSYVSRFLDNANPSDLEAAGVDAEYIRWSIGEGLLELSFEEASEIVDQLGISMDETVGRDTIKLAAVPGDERDEQFISLFSNLSQAKQEEAIRFLRYLVATEENSTP